MAGRGGLATGMYEVRGADGERIGPLYSAYAVARWYRDGNPDATGIWYVSRADAADELRRRELLLVEEAS